MLSIDKFIHGTHSSDLDTQYAKFLYVVKTRIGDSEANKLFVATKESGKFIHEEVIKGSTGSYFVIKDTHPFQL